MATETPSHQPQADEPKSPLWLPALGAALFLVAGIWWLAFGSDEAKPAASAEEAVSAAPSASAAPGDAGAAQPSPH